jgi:hypothetical protein
MDKVLKMKRLDGRADLGPLPSRPVAGRLGVLSALCFVMAAVTAEIAMAEEYHLEHRLEAVGAATPKSAKVKFTLANRGPASVRILPSNTPLEGEIHTRMFRVTCKTGDREETLPLQAPMRASGAASEPTGKIRGDDLLRSAIWIGKGESREAVVDLAPAYNLPASGECMVAYVGLITIVVAMEQGINTAPEYAFARAPGEALVLQLKPAD